MKRFRQRQLPFHKSRNGKRLGRPPRKGQRPVPHRQRDRFHPKYPLHVTLRMAAHVWQLRSRRCYRIIRRAFVAGCARFGCRIVDYSVQRNHIHLIVEAKDARCLSRAMQGFCIRVGKGLNTLMGRTGKGAVFAERYHCRVLRTPQQVRAARAYVMQNARRHGERFGPIEADPFASSRFFDGWKRSPVVREVLEDEPATGPPVTKARTWLLTSGWRSRGLVDPAEVPGR